MPAILWRRLDCLGHDACRLIPGGDGWRLEGAAVYREGSAVACLRYQLQSDSQWRTIEGDVQGWIGPRPVDMQVRRTPGGAWLLNGALVAGLDDCCDLDLGFTPATNLFQLRRLEWRGGPSSPSLAVELEVAWLDVAAGRLGRLAQRYQRRSSHAYGYEAPQFGYAAELQVDAHGFVVQYPGLWEAEPLSPEA